MSGTKNFPNDKGRGLTRLRSRMVLGACLCVWLLVVLMAQLIHSTVTTDKGMVASARAAEANVDCPGPVSASIKMADFDTVIAHEAMQSIKSVPTIRWLAMRNGIETDVPINAGIFNQAGMRLPLSALAVPNLMHGSCTRTNDETHRAC